MASKILILALIILHCLSMQATSLDMDAGRPIEFHITNVVPSNKLSRVDLTIRSVGGDFLPNVTLSRGEEYVLSAVGSDSYICMAHFGLEFAAVDLYVPRRDRAHAAVYWKVDDVGFYISYDKSTWRLDTRWESE